MNRHQFEQAAKHFRAGRITLSDFSAKMFPDQHPANEPLPQDQADADPLRLPKRPEDAHKGDFGRVLLIGGSQEMPGAIGLAGMAALRSGAGLVIIASPKAAAPTIAGYSPCYMTHGFVSNPADCQGLAEKIEWASVIGIGPGLQTQKDAVDLVVKLYRDYPHTLVVDADALNCLAVAQVDLSSHAGPRILTPHPGEFGRLVPGANLSGPRKEIEDLAVERAAAWNVTLVLKGHRSLITDGAARYQNSTGNSGMATGGSGDVLTGMVAALVGQKLEPLSAARLACHLHGLAGDIAAKQMGEISLVSSDLLTHLPSAIQEWKKGG